jgi:hypothetical protein
MLLERVRKVRRLLCSSVPMPDIHLALIDDPQYVKALQRRAASNEIIGSWSSLTSAQEGMAARA